MNKCHQAYNPFIGRGCCSYRFTGGDCTLGDSIPPWQSSGRCYWQTEPVKERKMEIHELKTDPYVFTAVWNGQKNYELRYNDRDFQVDDDVYLRETSYTGAEIKSGAPLCYTGRSIRVKIRHVLRGPIYGLAEGWCILALSPIMNKNGGDPKY